MTTETATQAVETARADLDTADTHLAECRARFESASTAYGTTWPAASELGRAVLVARDAIVLAEIGVTGRKRALAQAENELDAAERADAQAAFDAAVERTTRKWIFDNCKEAIEALVALNDDPQAPKADVVRNATIRAEAQATIRDVMAEHTAAVATCLASCERRARGMSDAHADMYRRLAPRALQPELHPLEYVKFARRETWYPTIALGDISQVPDVPVTREFEIDCAKAAWLGEYPNTHLAAMARMARTAAPAPAAPVPSKTASHLFDRKVDAFGVPMIGGSV